MLNGDRQYDKMGKQEFQYNYKNNKDNKIFYYIFHKNKIKKSKL